jgi:hypothetical protein
MIQTETRRGRARPVDLVREAARRVPPLRALYERHVTRNGGEILPYIFFMDAAAWAERSRITHAEDVRVLIDLLAKAMASKDESLCTLVALGFIENLGEETPLEPMLVGPLQSYNARRPK